MFERKYNKIIDSQLIITYINYIGIIIERCKTAFIFNTVCRSYGTTVYLNRYQGYVHSALLIAWIYGWAIS